MPYGEGEVSDIEPKLLTGSLTHQFRLTIDRPSQEAGSAPKVVVEAVKEDEEEDGWDGCDTMGPDGGPCD